MQVNIRLEMCGYKLIQIVRPLWQSNKEDKSNTWRIYWSSYCRVFVLVPKYLRKRTNWWSFNYQNIDDCFDHIRNENKQPHSLVFSDRPTTDNSLIQCASNVFGATTNALLIKCEWNNPAKNPQICNKKQINFQIS